MNSPVGTEIKTVSILRDTQRLIYRAHLFINLKSSDVLGIGREE
jgi:hypothetical protein